MALARTYLGASVVTMAGILPLVRLASPSSPAPAARCRAFPAQLPLLPARRLSCGTSVITGLVLIASAVLAGVVGFSYLVEALRPAPTIPTRLPWGPEIEIRSVTIDGLTLRYVATGEGPSLLLLHTLRTQLDMFQRTVHALAQTFRVYAVDLPGHGYSDIPETDLEPELFVRTVGGFLDELDLEDVVVVGESIGATIGLLLAARGHPRVKRVVAINPYDYDRAEELEEPRSRKRRPG